MTQDVAAVQIPDGYEAVGSAHVVEQGPASVRLRAGTATVEVTVLAPDLFRVGMFPDSRPVVYPDAAIARHDWSAGEVTVADESGSLRLETGAAAVVIDLDPLRIGFRDAAGRPFLEDDPDLGMGAAGPPPLGGVPAALGRPVYMYKRRVPGERYFGCGERTGGLEKTSSHQVFWNVDPPVGHNAAMNALYTSIPFLLALREGRAWGLFFDNPCRSEFDLARRDSSRLCFSAIGGDLVYYVFSGPSLRDVLDRYTDLTGRTPMPPLWALGYHQSSWNYETAEDVEAVARAFRERDIPCDAIYLDIDYMDGFRVFTWSPERFPDPDGLIARLGEQGFRVVTIVDPGVRVDESYSVYTSGRDAGYFCRTPTGEEYRNVVWPGVCAFPDFSDPDVRAWWGDQHAALLDRGVAGIWCDMNEPTVFIPSRGTLPDDTVHPGGGHARLHAQVHNLYGNYMAQATREGLERLRPDRRPFVISRAGYAGLQRFALQWTGDNSAWWEHLWMSMPQLQNMGLSGMAWAGVDIGGFSGDATGELLARWVEFGIFQPYCRNHSEKGTTRQEPWAFGEPYESIIRNMLKLRQRLLPYLYTLFEECHRTGAPILRPLLFEYPEDDATYSADDEFLVGDRLLVAPITRHGQSYRHVYLPAGTWFHLWRGERYEGPADVLIHAPLGEPAVFVRGDAPVPLWPAMNYVGERPADPLTLLIYPAGGRGALELYEDAGDGYAYLQGEYARTRVTCRSDDAGIIVEIGAREGSFVPERTRVVVELRGLEKAPSQVLVGGNPAEATFDDGTVTVSLDASAEARTVEVRR